VTAGLYGQEQVLVASEVDRVDDVRRACALHDQCGSSVDETVPERATIVVALIAWAQDRSPNPVHQSLNRFGVEGHLSRELA
jgi:hypothetical protein